jgi:hypothetical protein
VKHDGKPTTNLYSPDYLRSSIIPRLLDIEPVWIDSNHFIPGWEGNYSRGRLANPRVRFQIRGDHGWLVPECGRSEGMVARADQAADDRQHPFHLAGICGGRRVDRELVTEMGAGVRGRSG